MKTTQPIFKQVKALGIPFANHETDLYIPRNEQTLKIIADYPYKASVTTFINQVEGGIWFDVPFAYLPAWKH